jgi:hypothetical protein
MQALLLGGWVRKSLPVAGKIRDGDGGRGGD